MPPKATADLETTLCILRCAHMFRRSVADEVEAELADYKAQLRATRQWMRENAKSQPGMADMKARNVTRIQGQINRLNGLKKRMASLRGEHPSARLPTFKADVKPPCEPQIAAMAARLQESVERAVWDFLYAQKS